MSISDKAAKYFLEDRKFNSKNTKVEVSSDNHVRMYLFGNCIAIKYEGEPHFGITNCGWETITTKSRLNAILRAAELPYGIVKRGGTWFIREWSLDNKEVLEQFPYNTWIQYSI